MMKLLSLALLICLAPALLAQGDLFGVNPFANSYFVFDRTTGESTFSGTFTTASGAVTGANGAAIHPTTHEIYVILKVSGVTGRMLATLDVNSGQCTEIGNLGDNFSSLAFDSAGVLYGVTGDGATTPETLFTIDLLTGTPTLLHTLGNGADGEVIAFNPVDGLMYHASGNSTMVFETIDLVTGMTTNIPVMWSGETFGLVWDPDQGLFLKSNINSVLSTLTDAGVETPGPTLTDSVEGNIDARGLLLLPVSVTSESMLNLDQSWEGIPGPTITFDLAAGRLFADLVVSATASTEISLDGQTWTSSITLVPTAGEVAVTTIHVRLAASAAAGTVNDLIGLSSLNMITTFVSVLGEVNPAAPEIAVYRGVNQLANNDNEDVGDQTVGPARTLAYTIRNIGSLPLALTGTPVVSVMAGTNVQNVSVLAQPGTSVAAQANTAFTVSFEVVAAGAFDFAVSIDNDDSDENPFAWTVSGMGVIAPEIEISRGATAIQSGDTDNIGSILRGTEVTLTYSITNPGSADLNLGIPVVAANATNCTVTIETQPAATVALGGGATDLVVKVTSTAAGAYSFELTVNNDDPDEDTFTWTVSGTATSPPPADDGDDDDDGCSTGESGGSALMLIALLAAIGLGIRRRLA